MKQLVDLEEEYELEYERIIESIKREKAKKVLLQFPDAFKPYSHLILDKLKASFKDVEFFIWLGSCFGACDVPNVNEKDFDLIIQFGHSKWGYDDSIQELN